MTEEVKKLVQKADHALEVARKLLEDGYPSDAASKTYYAMFYATQALLKAEGIEVIKHSAGRVSPWILFCKDWQARPQISQNADRCEKDQGNSRL